ncbi:MAG: peroxiredoxin [Labilithrix sp.]|nr:peroxiredoxin [Labilithrix sp.]
MLKEGDKVPGPLLKSKFDAMTAAGDAGTKIALGDLAPGKTLVVFFYPKDSTPGCTREAQGFTASRRAIEKAGGFVVGVSRDSVKSHCSFRDKFSLDVPLVSDPDRVLHEGFGAWGEKVMYGKKVLGAIRSTFLVRDGKVVKVWPSVKVDGHVDQVLEALGGGGKAAPKPNAKTAAKAKPKAKAKSRK